MAPPAARYRARVNCATTLGLWRAGEERHLTAAQIDALHPQVAAGFLYRVGRPEADAEPFVDVAARDAQTAALRPARGPLLPMHPPAADSILHVTGLPENATVTPLPVAPHVDAVVPVAKKKAAPRKRKAPAKPAEPES